MPDLDNAPAERAQPREAAAENTVAQQNIQSQQDGSFSKTFQDQNNMTAKASEQMAQNGTLGKMEIGSDPNGKYGSMDEGGSKDHRNNDNRSKDHNSKDGNLTKQGTLEQYPDRLEGGSAQGGAGGRHGENFQPGFGGAGGKIGEKNGQPGEGGTGGFKPGRGIGQDGPVFDPRSDLRPKSDDGPGQYSTERNPFSKPTPNPGRSKW